MSTRRLPLAVVMALSLAGCSAPPEGPGLMTRAEIEAARSAAAAPPPDTDELQARAGRLAARAAQLRRAGIDSHDQHLLRQRGQALAAR